MSQAPLAAPKEPKLAGAAGWADEEGPIDYTPFEYVSRDLTADKDKNTTKMAQGGSVDEILALLGIYDQDDSHSTGDPYLDELLRSLR